MMKETTSVHCVTTFIVVFSYAGVVEQPYTLPSMHWACGTYYLIHYTGWLVHEAVTEDPEMATLLLWEKKAKERLRKRYSYTSLDSLLLVYIMNLPAVLG